MRRSTWCSTQPEYCNSKVYGRNCIRYGGQPYRLESWQLHSATWGMGDQGIEMVQYLDVENYIFVLG